MFSGRRSALSEGELTPGVPLGAADSVAMLVESLSGKMGKPQLANFTQIVTFASAKSRGGSGAPLNASAARTDAKYLAAFGCVNLTSRSPRRRLLDPPLIRARTRW